MFKSQILNLYYSALKYVIYLFASNWNEMFKKIPVIKKFVFSTHSLAVGFFIYSHVMEEKASLVLVRKTLIYECSKMSLCII